MKNWKTIRSKTAFKCKYMKIIEEDFMVPGGKKYKYYILKRNDYVIVLAKEKNYLYLIKQYRYTTKSKLLQVVAGAIEKGETPLQAAKKELKEEAGIKAKKFKKLGWFYAYYGCSNQRAHIFLAEDLELGKQKPDELEKEGGIKVVKLKISEVKRMIKSGKINDVDTISAFGLFMLKCKDI
ncbi:NUDIX domain-containing protein [Patescibacteria group bacterium]|nr:NUDIX domain-containing protein [Patescibacteria group bacterium]